MYKFKNMEGEGEGLFISEIITTYERDNFKHVLFISDVGQELRLDFV
jgi:hypothetical protein